MDWVRFDEIKKAVSLQMIIDRYGWKLRTVGQHTLRGKCPLPTHTSEKSKESFTATLTKGIGGAWVCQSQSCVAARSGQRGGNALDLVALMEGCSTRDAAIKMRAWFGVPASGEVALKSGQEPNRSQEPSPGAPGGQEPQEPPNQASREQEPEDESGGPNPPLTFTLRGIDPSHPYLAARGITRENAEAFGVGFFPGKGTMAGRVVVPIHDGDGQLVAYAGRAIDGSDPKYKFPAGFHKSHVLYNLNRVLTRAKAAVPNTPLTLVLVEGFFDCMKVYEAGFPAVALMGSSLSSHQEELLCAAATGVVLMFDGDETGRNAAAAIAPRLARRVWVRIIELAVGEQPDILSPDRLNKLLG